MVPAVKVLASQVWQPKCRTQTVEAENCNTWKLTYMCIVAHLCPPKHKINKLIKTNIKAIFWLVASETLSCGSYDTVAHGLTSSSTSNPPGASYAVAVNLAGWQSRCHCWAWPDPHGGEWQRWYHEQKPWTWILAPDHSLPVQDGVTKKMRNKNIPDNVVSIPKY